MGVFANRVIAQLGSRTEIETDNQYIVTKPKTKRTRDTSRINSLHAEIMPTLGDDRFRKRFPTDQTPKRDLLFFFLFLGQGFVSPRGRVHGELVHLPAG